MEEQNYLSGLAFTPMGFGFDFSTTNNPYFVDGITSQKSSIIETNQFQQISQDYDGYLVQSGIPKIQSQMLYNNIKVKPSIVVADADPHTYMGGGQQVPQSYVEFLSESVASGLQNQMEGSYPVEASGFMPANTFSYVEGHKITDQRLHDEAEEVGLLISLLNQKCAQEEKLNEEASHNLRFQSSQVTPTPRYPSRIRSEASKQRARESERLRKLKVSNSLEALQELVPHAMEGGKEYAIDRIIDYIKYLQLQMKDLSRTRLRDESVSTHLSFVQEHAQYLLDDDIPQNPLEEMMGKLLEDNFSWAMQFLQSRGLYLMPMSLAERLS